MLFKVTPWGGLTADHRYILKAVPLLLLPLGWVLDRLRAAARLPPALRGGLAALLAALALASFYRALEAVGLFASHAARLPGFRGFAQRPDFSPPELLAAAFAGVDDPAYLAVAAAVGLVALPAIVRLASAGAGSGADGFGVLGAPP
jgi:hypothetical protein